MWQITVMGSNIVRGGEKEEDDRLEDDEIKTTAKNSEGGDVAPLMLKWKI